MKNFQLAFLGVCCETEAIVLNISTIRFFQLQFPFMCGIIKTREWLWATFLTREIFVLIDYMISHDNIEHGNYISIDFKSFNT